MNLPPEYKKVSNKNGGEYAGPCWFTHEGNDRFIIYPNEVYNGKPRPNWFCRHGCSNCPGKNTSMGGKWGLFTDDIAPFTPLETPKPKPKRNVPSVTEGKVFQKLLTKDTVRYMRSRGVNDKVMREMNIGTYKRQSVAFPNIVTFKGKEISYGVKYRILPQYYRGGAKYRMIAGSRAKTIYNFNALDKHSNIVVIVESIIDVLVLKSLGITSVCPFGGGGIWDTNWYKFFDCDTIINIGDRDTPAEGQDVGAGQIYADKRAVLLAPFDAKYKYVITAMPPEPFSDIGDMQQAGKNVKEWLVALYQNNRSA